MVQLKSLIILLASTLVAQYALAATATATATVSTSKLDTNTTTAAAKSPYELTWSTSLEANRTEDSLSNQKNQMTLGFKLSFDMKFNNWLSMNLTPKAVIQNGYVQSVDVVDPKGNRIDINNASIDMKPSAYFSSSIGALNQSTQHDNLFMSSRAFPSARILVNNNSTSNKLFSFIEAAMPTSASMSNNSNDLNQTPSLMMGGVGLELGSEKSTVNFKAQANGFQFDGLSTSLSTASVLLGNSGRPSAGIDQQFKYQFQGIEAFSTLKFKASRILDLVFSGAYITNTQAPTEFNTGWVARTEARYDLSNKIQLIPTYEYFRIESDATISSYNESNYNTNRVGYMGGLKINYNKTVKFGFSAGQRTAIIERPSQPDENMYLLTVETADAKL